MEISSYVYTASAGETFDLIALGLWGNEKYACDLICANPQYAGKMIFAGGEELRLPVIELGAEESPYATQAPWRDE